jgi:hypothetical protein
MSLRKQAAISASILAITWGGLLVFIVIRLVCP